MSAFTAFLQAFSSFKAKILLLFAAPFRSICKMMSLSPSISIPAKMETVAPNSEKMNSSDALSKENSADSPAVVTGSPSGSEGELKLPSPGKARQRNSISLNVAGRGLLAGLPDYDSDDDDDGKTNVVKNASSAPIPVVVSNPKASGGPQHRPLVGGFAAAAYEAARVDYYKKQGMQVTGHEIVQIKSMSRGHLPKYP